MQNITNKGNETKYAENKLIHKIIAFDVRRTQPKLNAQAILGTSRDQVVVHLQTYFLV